MSEEKEKLGKAVKHFVCGRKAPFAEHHKMQAFTQFFPSEWEGALSFSPVFLWASKEK
jgi:hypothetical protein